MRKIIFAVTAAALAMTAITPAFAADFTDISGSQYEWCADAIEAMADAGYIDGVDDSTFAPDSNVTKLQGICLFARAMGSRDSSNEKILELAHEKYDDALSSCSLSYGEDELAYMLFEGALTTADLTTYITGDTKNKDMTRGEAAVIITKAMGGEEYAQTLSSVSLTYDDASSIASNILPYVKYVTENGIMNGIDNDFQASGTVTRAQMAVMLSRVVESCQYEFYTGNYTSYDEADASVTLNLAPNGSVTVDLVDELRCSIIGEQCEIDDLPENVGIVAKFSGDTLIGIDAISDTPDEVVTMIYSSQVTQGNTIYLKVKKTASTSTIQTYTCAEDVPITYEGSPATIKTLSSGDAVTLTISGGLVTSIEAAASVDKVTNATVDSIDISDDGTLTMTISHANSAYDGKTYVVADDATVTKANVTDPTMADVYVGDKVTLDIRYGQIAAVEATSTYTSVTGTLVSLTIAEQPSVTVRVDGKEKTYQVATDCAVTVNGSDAELYDFRVGDTLLVTVQSGAATKIACSPSVINTDGRVSGTVTVVNTAYGFMSVAVEGSDYPVTVFCTASSTTFIDSKGSSMKLASVKSGDTVECHGTTSNGAFVANVVIVTRSSD